MQMAPECCYGCICCSPGGVTVCFCTGGFVKSNLAMPWKRPICSIAARCGYNGGISLFDGVHATKGPASASHITGPSVTTTHVTSNISAEGVGVATLHLDAQNCKYMSQQPLPSTCLDNDHVNALASVTSSSGSMTSGRWLHGSIVNQQQCHSTSAIS